MQMKTEIISLDDLYSLENPKRWISNQIRKCNIIHVTNSIDPNYILKIINYLTKLMTSTLPNYHPLITGAPNFYRINFDDPRSHVKAFFHQFNFFEWNQDLFEIFNHLGFLFQLKAWSNWECVDYSGTIKRISFQFYPSGRGYMNMHKDPVGKHQAGVVSVVMSGFHKDYNTGGFFIEYDEEVRIYPEQNCEVGDILIFNGSLAHGVETIDAEEVYKPLGFDGRWMSLIAVTKDAENQAISNSVDLQK